MYGHALIVGKFAPFHRGHQHLIETALAKSRRVTILCYANPDFPEMPSATRAKWIRRIFQGVAVLVPNDPPPDASDDFTHRQFVRDWLAEQDIAVNTVFTGEEYGEGFASHLGVVHEMVDRERLAFPVSGTQVRRDPHGNSHWLHEIVREALVR